MTWATLRSGSSPLARGTRRTAPGNRALRRFIPARAGNTVSSRLPSELRPVHPRSRGEHPLPHPSSFAAYGSSPLARGTRPRGRAPARHHRFIPARAGNTCRPRTWCTSSPVHPRSRGEHSPDGEARLRAAGSSPLARGTLALRPHEADPARFIPARAGNTGSPWSRPSPRPVHPRSRGEHASRSANPPAMYGSSPLARGTHITRPGRSLPRRFIPARAGNTPRTRSSSPTAPVHPRSRGEHACLRQHTTERQGHPRSRGEHSRTAAWMSTTCGSSPLARGTRAP